MKKIVPVLLILLLLGVGGYFLMNSRGSVPKNNIGTSNKNSDSNVFTSIEDALSKSMSLKCVYKDEKGVETTTYIKGGSVRVSMVSTDDKEQPNSIVMKDKKMYMWNETTKEGFVYELTDPEITPDTAMKKEDSLKQDKTVLAQIEKYKDSCKAEIIADSFFQVPTDVNFQDMSAFTKNLMKQVPTVSQTNDTSSVDSQKLIEEMMKKISPEAGNDQ